MAMHKTELVTKNCVVCGKPFTVCPPGKTSRSCQRPFETEHCTRTCHNKARYRQGVECGELTPTQAAYIAGFLDGEGSIMLINQSHERIGLRVTFTNCDPGIMEWLKATTGVGVSVLTRHDEAKHRPAYIMALNTQPAYSLLKQVLPYLIIKKAQAELAIQFTERQAIPKEKADQSWQLEMKAAMQAMNLRGPRRGQPA